MDIEKVKELGLIIKAIYEKYEMLSRWTPEFTAKEFLIIIAMRKEKSFTVSKLARKLGFPMSTTSFLVDGLVSKGIVLRKRKQSDRRVVSLRLTEKGREALSEYDGIFERIGRHMLETLSGDDSGELLRLLGDVVGNINKIQY